LTIEGSILTIEGSILIIEGSILTIEGVAMAFIRVSVRSTRMPMIGGGRGSEFIEMTRAGRRAIIETFITSAIPTGRSTKKGFILTAIAIRGEMRGTKTRGRGEIPEMGRGRVRHILREEY
jgi:hypothetical protein